MAAAGRFNAQLRPDQAGHRQIGFMFTSFGQLVACLHSHKRLSLHTKGMLEPDRHIGRQRCPAIEQRAERLPADAERGGQIVDRHAMGFDNLGLQPLSGVDRE